MNISDKALLLIDIVEKAGFEAYAVGGCVRDSIMKRACSDVDIAVSATPFETEEILKKHNVSFYETGLKHGTITAVLQGECFEITTFRTDGDYKDNRHPENVRFVKDIKEDLSRRDFTINAMAYNEKTGVVDLFGGKKDLENKIIRAVGDADTRFKEDALRIMRALRFASQLSFEIEEGTSAAIFRNKDLLRSVSAERIFSELSKLLLGDGVFKILTEYKEVLAVVIPELKPSFDCQQINPWHIYDVWTHTCRSVEACPKDLKLRLTMLLHDIGKPATKTTDEKGINHFKGHQAVSAEASSVILKRLKVSNDIYNYAMAIIPIHDITVGTDKKNIKKWLGKLNEEYFRGLIAVKRADKLAQNPQKTATELKNLDIILSSLDEIISQNEAFTVKELAVNGRDLIELGLTGKAVGDALNALLERVIGDELENSREALLDYVKDNLI